MWLKYVYISVDIGNHRYTNEQICILKKCDLKKYFARLSAQNFFCPPIPKSSLRPCIVPSCVGLGCGSTVKCGN